MSHDADEYLVERLTTDGGTDDGALQFDENALPRSGRSSAWGDGQITPEMIQAADQEIKTRFPVFYDTTDLSARHDLIRAIESSCAHCRVSLFRGEAWKRRQPSSRMIILACGH